MDPEIEHRCDDYNAVGLEYPVYLLKGHVWEFHVFKGVEGDDRAYRTVGLVNLVEVENSVDSRALAHIAPHIVLSGEKRPQVSDAFQARRLKGAELIDGLLDRQGPGYDPGELSDRFPHQSCPSFSSLSECRPFFTAANLHAVLRPVY